MPVAVLGLASLSSAHGATLAQFTFDSASASTADATDANLTVSTFSGSGGAGVSSFSDMAFIFSDDTDSTLAAAITNGDYWEFTITVNAGFTMDLTQLSFDHLTSGDGGVPGGTYPYTGNLSTFVNNFTAGDVLSTSTQTLNAANGATSELLGSDAVDLSTYQNITGTTTFRVYAYDDSPNTIDQPVLRLDNLLVTGTVTAVPEPTSNALLGLASLAMILRRRRGAC